MKNDAPSAAHLGRRLDAVRNVKIERTLRNYFREYKDEMSKEELDTREALANIFLNHGLIEIGVSIQAGENLLTPDQRILAEKAAWESYLDHHLDLGIGLVERQEDFIKHQISQLEKILTQVKGDLIRAASAIEQFSNFSIQECMEYAIVLINEFYETLLIKIQLAKGSIDTTKYEEKLNERVKDKITAVDSFKKQYESFMKQLDEIVFSSEVTGGDLMQLKTNIDRL